MILASFSIRISYKTMLFAICTDGNIFRNAGLQTNL